MPETKDKLCYYSKSKNAPVGKGTNEYVKDISIYRELNGIDNWRKILSNFYVEPFMYEGYNYNSVEHAFQAQKIMIVDKQKAYWFTLDSKHYIGMGNGEVAQKNRKLVVLNKEQLNYWNSIKYDAMKNITEQRIIQSEIYRKVLFLTQNAELWHVIMRKGIVRNKYLEKLRNKYKINSDKDDSVLKKIKNFCLTRKKEDFDTLEIESKNIFLECAKMVLEKGVKDEYYTLALKILEYSKEENKNEDEERNIKILSWNINGIRSNVLSTGKLAKCGWEKEPDKAHDFGKVIKDYSPDIICLQETKCDNKVGECIKIPGYYQYWSCSIKAGYSGVSIWTKEKPKSVSYNIPTLPEPDNDGRIIVLEYENFILINTYCPNSGTNFEYRTKIWDIAMLKYLQHIKENGKNVIWCGDLNVSPNDIDVHEGVTENVAGFTPEERENFKNILGIGYIDTLRYLNPDVKNLYSWWNMRVPIARTKNIGMRLDYFVTNDSFIKNVKNSEILAQYGGKTKESPAVSDHAPVLLTLVL